MRNHLNSEQVEVIDISPMGCRTGFYMSLIGAPTEQKVSEAWLVAMHDVLNVEHQDDIPELNEYQCGTYKMHSLIEAKTIAQVIIDTGISINKNDEIALSDVQLQQL